MSLYQRAKSLADSIINIDKHTTHCKLCRKPLNTEKETLKAIKDILPEDDELTEIDFLCDYCHKNRKTG